MKPGVTIITATGCRPEALALCAHFVTRQDYDGPLQWIIVDDGERPSEIDLSRVSSTMTVTRLFPKPNWEPGENTLARNLLAAISEVKYDAIVAIEG